MAPTLFRILLYSIVLFALWRGGREERLVALMCLAGSLSTHFLISPLANRFSGLEVDVLAIDLSMLAGFVWIALRSHRFWPLWVAGLQLTTVMGHLFKTLDTGLVPRAYAASLAFWAYLILLILGIATWRSVRRRKDHLPPDSPFMA